MTKVELWFKENRCILRELMFQTDTESVALGHCAVITVLIVQETASVIKICDLGTFLHDLIDGTVLQVVSGKVHVTVAKSEGTVKSSHP